MSDSEASEIRYVRVKAPFAAFRWHQAGNYRATSPIIPPTTAWGLLLNLAAIDSRDSKSLAREVTTLIDPNAPSLHIAVGSVTQKAQKSKLYQQLHHYPVGGASKIYKERARGNKYHISPTWREVLVDFDAIIAVRASQSLLERMQQGLDGDFNSTRYGIPFLGDNNCLIDSITMHESSPVEVYWYEQLGKDDRKMKVGSCRLTTFINRADSSKTSSVLFAPLDQPSKEVPDAAWVEVKPL